MDSWNDERLDELSRRMDAGFEKAATKEEMNLRFDELGRQMSQRFTDVDAQLGRLHDRLDRVVNTFLIASATVTAAVIGNAIFG